MRRPLLDGSADESRRKTPKEDRTMTETHLVARVLDTLTPTILITEHDSAPDSYGQQLGEVETLEIREGSTPEQQLNLDGYWLIGDWDHASVRVAR